MARHLTSSSITVGGLLGVVGLAPETLARLTWWVSKVQSFDNVDPSTVLSEAVQILSWCALPSVVGAMVGALVSTAVATGVERALTGRG